MLREGQRFSALNPLENPPRKSQKFHAQPTNLAPPWHRESFI